jgi:hypothetical protein
MFWRENYPAELASAAIEATQCYGHAFFFCHESQNGFLWEKGMQCFYLMVIRF